MKISSHKPHNILLKRINPLLRFMIVSDMLIVGSLAMFANFYALFVEDTIVGAGEFEIGISMSIYLLSRSVLQIPIATLLDKVKGEKDDYFLLILFSFTAAILNLAFLKISTVWHLYALQVLLGIVTAVTYPSYMAIFTRHVDKNMEGTEWGIYYTFVDISSAALASFGGYVAQAYGFRELILIVSSLCLLGAVTLIPIRALTFRK